MPCGGRGYLCESVLRPSAKIAQSFDTVRIQTKSGPAVGSAATATTPATEAADYLGFVGKETADDVQVRDASGKVVTIKKSSIAKRAIVPGSIMPEGLTDNLSLDDFASLIGFLESMK